MRTVGPFTPPRVPRPRTPAAAMICLFNSARQDGADWLRREYVEAALADMCAGLREAGFEQAARWAESNGVWKLPDCEATI